jgi:hypothetical protein
MLNKLDFCTHGLDFHIKIAHEHYDILAELLVKCDMGIGES